MSLPSGTRLGPYEIVGALGAGGMGEVYRARDTRLDRTVAIKVLPAQLAADAEFRERFDREARSISALDHPNICAVYDVGHDRGIDFIVMAFVEGETLAVRLERGALKLDEALRCGMEIASALEKAHRAGIVHRDVKPSNVMLTAAGSGSTSAPQAKLLDFGLAKLAAPAAPGSLTALPTTPHELTAAGTILGTFQYMAPEQLEGADADARTDIFSFGAVLYEMATGRKAFEGKSRASLISAILRDDPPKAGPAADPLPAGLDRVVRRCLAKNPEDRWQTASDLLEALRWVRDGSDGHEAVAAPALTRSRVREGIAWMLVLALGGFAGWLWFKPKPAPPVVRLTIGMPRGDTSGGAGLAFAPDGSTVVFPATHDGVSRLYRRRIDQLEPVPIRGTEGGEFPFFSADGRWIGFFATNVIQKVPLEGGPPTTLVRTQGFRRGASWGANDTIIFATDSSPDLMSIPSAGGSTPTTLVSGKAFTGATLRWPSWRRDGSAVLFTVWSGDVSTARVGAYSIASGQARAIVDGTSPLALASGELLFGRGGSLWAVSMDWKNLSPTNDAVPVLEGVTVNIGGSGLFSAADNGSLAYVTGIAVNTRVVSWMTRDGQRQTLLDKPMRYINPAVSRDGRQVAVQIASTEGEDDIWIYEVTSKVLRRLTFGGGRHTNPVWTPDGRRIIYSQGTISAGGRSLYSTAADGSGDTQRLTDSTVLQIPCDVSPDGGTLLFSQGDSEGRMVLWTLPLLGDRTPRQYLRSAGTNRADAGFSGGRAQFSPDGKWVAYPSTESGPLQVFVSPFPGPGGKWQISTDVGLEPVWSRSGKELFFFGNGAIRAVDVQTGASFTHGEPHDLFTYNPPTFSDYAVAADGRFILLTALDQAGSAEVQVILNWSNELKRR